MRLLFLTLLEIVFLATLAKGQNETTFTINIATTEVRLGELFEVKFVLENGNNAKFIPPDWEAAGFLVGNTSQSSSFSFSNGSSKSFATYQFEVMARDTGLLEIPAALVKIQGKEDLRTPPQTIHVLPGDGINLDRPNKGRHPVTPSKDPKEKIKTIRL